MAVDLTPLLVILDFFWTLAGLFVDMRIEDCLKKAFFHEKFKNIRISRTSSVRNSIILEFLTCLLWLAVFRCFSNSISTISGDGALCSGTGFSGYTFMPATVVGD